MRDVNNINPMRRDMGMSASNWAGWLGVLAGIWLIIAPFILNYGNSTATTNDIVLGIILIILTGFCAITAGQANTAGARQVAGWLSVLAGIWLIIAPFVLGYSGLAQAVWNDIITGVLSIIVAGYGVAAVRNNYNTPVAS